jgi:hypothetical protein
MQCMASAQDEFQKVTVRAHLDLRGYLPLDDRHLVGKPRERVFQERYLMSTHDNWLPKPMTEGIAIDVSTRWSSAARKAYLE